MNTSYLNAVDEHRRQTGNKYKERGGFQDLLVECMKKWEPGVSHRNEVLKKEDRIEWFCRICPHLRNRSPHEFLEAMRMPNPPAQPETVVTVADMREAVVTVEGIPDDLSNGPAGEEKSTEEVIEPQRGLEAPLEDPQGQAMPEPLQDVEIGRGRFSNGRAEEEEPTERVVEATRVPEPPPAGPRAGAESEQWISEQQLIQEHPEYFLGQGVPEVRGCPDRTEVLREGIPIDLTGPFHGDSYGRGGTHDLEMGPEGLDDRASLGRRP
jgi:hypothetical protein